MTVVATGAETRVWSTDGTYLALDTSTQVGSVCLGVGGRVVASGVIYGQGSHSSDLIPAVAEVLRAAGADLSELDGLVVGSGPGSFTGVRVAAATAKGLAHALHVPLWAISSLEAGAASMDIDETEWCGDADRASDPLKGRPRTLSDEERTWPRYVLFDARADRVYGACYRPTEGGFEVLVPPHATTIGDLLSKDLPHLIFAGDGAQRHEIEIRAAGMRLSPALLGMPTAAGLLRAAEKPSRAPVENVALWEPDYLRPSSAERFSGSGA
jgi:tRNA threonylcarbamoyl adenosine modification protein YeaZ